MTVDYAIDMSADPDKDTACPHESEKSIITDSGDYGDGSLQDDEKKRKKKRTVSFPDDHQIVTQYFEPSNPWCDVPATTRAELAAEYLEACRRHNTLPIESVLQQIRELPEPAIGGSTRAARLALSDCILLGAAPVDALEAVLKKVQFKRLEIQDAAIDDEGAEAIFDMVEYYESATVVSITGPRQFGIRGWQAVTRMIKKSAELSELEVAESPLEASHAPVLSRALKTHACRLRALSLQQCNLCGEPLLCLVIALKANTSVRELRLGDNNLSAADAAQVASLLRYNTRIQLLDLSNNQIQDAGLAHIADAIVEQAAQSPPSPLSPHNCPLGYDSRGLAFLVLWNNQLTRNCAPHISKALRVSTSLCVLNIGRNPVGGDAVRAIAASRSVVSCGLQCARLTADCAAALGDLLRAAPALQRLDLRENRLGIAGLRAILSALKENNTVTQIDLDDPVESSSLSAVDSEQAAIALATREIRAMCRRNEPAASRDYLLHRKISLTCHTQCLVKSAISEECAPRSRLRSPLPSPAPSPAGSPVPAQHSRFSVTRVTPERDSSTDSSSPSTPTRTSNCSTPSRFKVVQVVEPPQIQVHPATAQQRKPTSRFSVTRNYDIMYDTKCTKTDDKVSTVSTQTKNITVVASAPTQPSIQSWPRDTPESTKNTSEVTLSTFAPTKDRHEGEEVAINTSSSTKSASEIVIEPSAFTKNETEVALNALESTVNTIDVTIDTSAPTKNASNDAKIAPNATKNTSEVAIGTFAPIFATDSVINDVIDSDMLQTKNIPVIIDVDKLTEHGIDENKAVNESDIKQETKNYHNSDIGLNNTIQELAPDIVVTRPESVTPEPISDISVKQTNVLSDRDKGDKNIVKCDVTYSDVVKSSFKDKSEQLTHNEEIIDDKVKSETKLVKNSVQVSESEKIDVDIQVTVKKETAKVHSDQNCTDVDVVVHKDDSAMKQIETITEDLGNLIQEMKELTSKKDYIVPVDAKGVVLKKNKSESSLDSPDLEVSRLMNRKQFGSPFCDSNSSLDIGSSIEGLNKQENIGNPELDRRKTDIILSTESSLESASELPVILNTSVSSNDSVSPIFGKKIHDSLSSLEVSVSSLDSAKQEKLMVTSADSGIEHSINPENKDGNSSNEGTLTNNSSFKETVKPDAQDTLTTPKRTSSLLDVPAFKSKGLDRMRKMSWITPSPSFHMPRQEDKEPKQSQSHLEGLLGLFHQSSLFSKTTSEDERKSSTNTTPRKESSLTSSFWSWGSGEKEKEIEDRDSSSEATDSTLSEGVRVSFVDESFSKKLDSKTPSTDTDNTLSESQFHGNESEIDVAKEKDGVTETTDDNLVQIGISLMDNGSNGNRTEVLTSDIHDLIKPNDLNKNFETGDSNKNPASENIDKDDKEQTRPRSFAAVLKSSGSENSLEKQNSPDNGQPVDKLPTKIIRGIKENISPENTLTASMSNTKALAFELEKQKNQPVPHAIWEVAPLLEQNESNIEEIKALSELAPIATIDETSDEAADIDITLQYIDDVNTVDHNLSSDSGVTLEIFNERKDENIDLGKDALSYLLYENQDFEPDTETNVETKVHEASLAQELMDAETKEMLDLSPELVIDDVQIPVFVSQEMKLRASPIIPERAKLIKSNSLEDISQLQSAEEKAKIKTIAFKVPETTTPRDIPRRSKLRSRSGSSPKSLPDSLNRPCPLVKMDSVLRKKKKKISSLGKIARDSLLALNMSEDEIAEFQKSYKLTSVESLRSLESVSEDANSQSGNSADSRCRACLRMSQESLMSLDSITEDCRCAENCNKPGHSAR